MKDSSWLRTDRQFGETDIMFSQPKAGANPMRRGRRFQILLAFACIYFVWGSTYLAIRYAVETIPPLFVAGLRHLIAGGLLFGWCWWQGLRPNRQHWFATIVLAALFFLIGHGSLHWAQQTLPSGVAALLIATEPIFVVITLTVLRRTRITPSLVTGLLLGLVGVALVMSADVSAGHSAMLSSFVVLIGTASWSIGMVYSRSATLHPDARMSAAMTLLVGAAMLLVVGALMGEAADFNLAVVSLKSLVSVGYLTIAGSLVAYSAYFWLLNRFPPALISTHTYVNPPVALLLGWALAGETLTTRFVVGAVIIIVAIVLMGKATSETPTRGQQRDASPKQPSAKGAEYKSQGQARSASPLVYAVRAIRPVGPK